MALRLLVFKHDPCRLYGDAFLEALGANISFGRTNCTLDRVVSRH